MEELSIEDLEHALVVETDPILKDTIENFLLPLARGSQELRDASDVFVVHANCPTVRELIADVLDGQTPDHEAIEQADQLTTVNASKLIADAATLYHDKPELALELKPIIRASAANLRAVMERTALEDSQEPADSKS